MAFGKLWVLAFRDLRRNRRRSLLTMIAVALGLALLMVMNGYIAGVVEESLQNNIRLNTGHVQVRVAGYNDEELSLRRSDLIANPEQLAAEAAALPGVRAAAPVLWAGAIVATPGDSVRLRVYGIDTASPVYDPIRDALVAGAFIAPDDRDGIMIGRRLADSLGVPVGGKVSLTVVDADGQPEEGIFTVRGLFATGIPSYDDSAALLPLAKAQALAHASRQASAIFVVLDRQADTPAVAAALRAPGRDVRTWEDLNRLLLDTMQTGMAFYIILDGIVMLIVAVILANTLLMSVFERIREMGILSALGMKGRHLMGLFLLEAALLGTAGMALGAALGLGGVGYLSVVGIPIGDMASSAGNVALASTLHARFVPETFAGLAVAMLAVMLVAALYPAWYAARLEPVEALRAS